MHPPVTSPESSAPADRQAEPRLAFIAACRRSLAGGAFVSLVLSKPRAGDDDAASAVRVRRIFVKGAPTLSFVATHATRDVTRNLGIDAGLDEIASLLGDDARPGVFAHATLHVADGDTQLLVSKKGKATLRQHHRTAPAAPAAGSDAPPAHDRVRRRRLSLELPFLNELGLTDAQHRVVPSMARKWRQIDKFLEVLDQALEAVPAAVDGPDSAPLRIVDYGCGKGYLTFAVYEHLRRRTGRAPTVTGVERRADLVGFCNDVAARTGSVGLTFLEGDLQSVAPAAMDVMIALHACDTATDHAIALGVRAGAQVLICSPCCHKELRPQLARPRLLSGLLRHGIHLGQEAEMVTDSMRALLLETRGYEAQVFEFVSLEHTSKNKMILARLRGPGSGREAIARVELDDLKSFYGIREQRLDELLQAAAPSSAAAAQACQTP